MIQSGAKGYHFGNKINMVEVLEKCPKDVLVMGNLDPVGIFKMASSDTMRNETLKLLKQTEGFQNFILSSGCDIPPHTPFENIQAFFDTLNDYNNRNPLT